MERQCSIERRLAVALSFTKLVERRQRAVAVASTRCRIMQVASNCYLDADAILLQLATYSDKQVYEN